MQKGSHVCRSQYTNHSWNFVHGISTSSFHPERKLHEHEPPEISVLTVVNALIGITKITNRPFMSNPFGSFVFYRPNENIRRCCGCAVVRDPLLLLVRVEFANKSHHHRIVPASTRICLQHKPKANARKRGSKMSDDVEYSMQIPGATAHSASANAIEKKLFTRIKFPKHTLIACTNTVSEVNPLQWVSTARALMTHDCESSDSASENG